MHLSQFMDSLQGDAFPALLLLVKATGVILLAATAALCMRRASAEARHQVWLVAMVGLLLLPALASWGPLPVPVLPASFARPIVDPQSQVAFQGSPKIPEVPETPARAVAPPASPYSAASDPAIALDPDVRAPALSFANMLVAIWLIGVVLLLTRFWYGQYRLRRIVQRAQTLDDISWQLPLYEIGDRLGLEVAPKLLRSTDVWMPFACGLLRGTVVLPAESDNWSAERRTAVLIHELGHLRRRDLIGHTISRLVCTIYWFHPMVWTSARYLRDESERACDDLVLMFGTLPSEYAEHLLEIVVGVRDHPAPSAALALARQREFEGRMLAILDPERRRSSPRRWQKFSVIGVLAISSVVLAAAAPMVRTKLLKTKTSAVPKNLNDQKFSFDVGNSMISPEDSTDPDAGMMDTTWSTDGEKVLKIKRHDRSLRLREELLSLPTDDDPSEILAKVLSTDTSATVRRIAAWGLHEHLDNTVAVEAVIGALAHDSDAEVRKMSAWALGEGEASVGNAELLGAVLHDKSDAVREMAAWALGEHENNSAADALGNQLILERSETVRGTIAWALGQMNLDSAPKGLIEALADPNDDVRYKVSWALSEIGDRNALPALRDAIAHEQHDGARRAQIRALIVSGEKHEALTSLLSASEPNIREMAVRALAGQSDPGPWPWPWPRPMPVP